ncbi:hypothetical protein [Kitasatospora sp. DSM 101779]|uniref:hypothetical protein n=1 Tax=Kitasatospora sp. DSM 101779 TaxID=2853165 RepID=UPI0021D912F6|nr:hypothetical protein [Kitasatospora sp. DSM 101779]MCU7826739.1 hypothetical protein [Kitasatospora sp. DSM 101779]
MTDRDGERWLAIYLNDHLAGSYGGAALARRIAREHPTGPDAPALRTLAKEVAEDRDELLALMRALGVRPRRHRMLLGSAAELAGRLKLNGRVLRRSPLSDLLETEAMRSGVQGKIALWRALRAASSDDLLTARLQRLADRADRHAEILDARQAEAAELLRHALGRNWQAAKRPDPLHSAVPEHV